MGIPNIFKSYTESEKDVENLLKALRKERNPEVRQKIAEDLLSIKDRKAAELLLGASRDDMVRSNLQKV